MRALSILLAVSLCFATPAEAGERYIGIIVSGAGADTSNDSTATPFKVPPGAKLTIVCNASANICVDTNTACTALGSTNPGLPVTANEKFPTSVGTEFRIIGSATAANGGAIVRIVGTAAVSCTVWERRGSE